MHMLQNFYFYPQIKTHKVSMGEDPATTKMIIFQQGDLCTTTHLMLGPFRSGIIPYVVTEGQSLCFGQHN